MDISVRDVRYTNDAALIRGFGDKKDKCPGRETEDPEGTKTLDKLNQLIYTP